MCRGHGVSNIRDLPRRQSVPTKGECTAPAHVFYCNFGIYETMTEIPRAVNENNRRSVKLAQAFHLWTSCANESTEHCCWRLRDSRNLVFRNTFKDLQCWFILGLKNFLTCHDEVDYEATRFEPCLLPTNFRSRTPWKMTDMKCVSEVKSLFPGWHYDLFHLSAYYYLWTCLQVSIQGWYLGDDSYRVQW